MRTKCKVVLWIGSWNKKRTSMQKIGDIATKTIVQLKVIYREEKMAEE